MMSAFPMETNVIRLMPRALTLAALVLGPGVGLCAPPAGSPAPAARSAAADAARRNVDSAVEAAVESAIERGLAWILVQNPLEVGDLYALQQLRRDAARRHVEAELRERAGALGPFEGLVRPGVVAAKPREWAAMKGQRYEPLAIWLYHAANAPSVPTPEDVLSRLVKGQHAEYLLAHQYLALRILRERGVLSGPGLEARLESLLQDIEGEQRAESGFSDLFAEREALLLSGGRVAEETRAWIARILAAQEDDGRWRVPRHPYPTTLNEVHTTLVSLWALDEYSRILAARRAENASPATP